MVKALLSVLMFAAVSSGFAAGPGQWSDREVVAPAGVLDYRAYHPAAQHYKGAILGLHGCHEKAQDFAALTRLQDLADREELVLVVPEQSPELNSDLCWNWFLPVNQARLGGEPQQFMMALQDAIQNLSVPSDRIFVVGMSAGAIMANIMGSCYPEVFSGVAIHSGIQYGEPLKAQDAADGSMRCPEESSVVAGNLAFSCSGLTPTRLPSVILFHGDIDQRVYPCNEAATSDQWLQMSEWAGSPSSMPNTTSIHPTNENGYSYDVTDWVTPTWGMRKVLIHGMAHAWSGGPTGIPYSDPLGPNATQMFWDFFMIQKFQEPSL